MLFRYDPFREMDRWFEQTLRRPASLSMPMDAYRRGEDVVVHFDLPGVAPDSIDLTIDKDVLTVRATRTYPEREGDEIFARERPQGTFERRVALSESLDRDRLEARYENGVLTIRMPVREAAKPRRIPVAVHEAPNAVDVGAAERSSAA